MLKGKYIYKAGIDGDLTIEEQIEQVKTDSIRGGYSTRDFSSSFPIIVLYDECGFPHA